LAGAKLEPFAVAPVGLKKEESMIDQDGRNTEKSEMGVLWIITGAFNAVHRQGDRHD
jgi:hypothetical protein